MNVKLTSCAICEATFGELREHCPVCGARRQFLASHSFERTHVVVRAISWPSRTELVRAIRSDVGFKFIAR